MGVVGEFNSNLKELEKLTNSTIYFRGNSILIKNGSGKNEIVKNAIQFLAGQFINNGSIEKKDIISSINKFMIEEKNNKSNQNIEGKIVSVLITHSNQNNLFGKIKLNKNTKAA